MNDLLIHSSSSSDSSSPSKKTRKNNNPCGKGVTDEVLRFRGLIKELKIKNKKIQKKKILPKDTNASTKGKEASTKGINDQ